MIREACYNYGIIFHCSPLEMQRLPITEIIRQIESGNKVIHKMKDEMSRG